MNDKTVVGVHWSFWMFGAVALIWNVMGVINYLVQMNANALAAMPETHRAIVEGRPAWATGAFAIAVFGGALGVAASTIDFSPFEILMMIVMPLVVAAFLRSPRSGCNELDDSPCDLRSLVPAFVSGQSE